jgi:dTDP-glucose 4,6-dehydratase
VGRYLVESVVHFNEISGNARCKISLPTRQPDLLRERYRRQIESGDIVIMEWSEDRSIDVNGRDCDFIIHVASPSDPKLIMEDPGKNLRSMVNMSSHIAETARKFKSERAVLVSSGAVYGEQPAGMQEIPEGFLGAPDISKATSCYGEGKRLSEMLFHLSGIDHRIARVFSLTGPYQSLNASFAVPDLIRQAAEKGCIHLSGDGTPERNYCYATDLTIFLFKLLLGKPDHEVYNVGCREGTTTIAQLAQTISTIFGGLEISRSQEDSGSSSSCNRYVPQLNRMYEFYHPLKGLREGLLRTCHSLYNRGVIGRQPAKNLRANGSENGTD